jgi:hypothetical protein
VQVQAAPNGIWKFIHDEVYRLSVRQKEQRLADGTTIPLRSLAVEFLLDPILRTVMEETEIAISVRPATQNLRIWALLSEANISTQRVRLSTPE